MHWLRTPKYLASIQSTHISLLLVSLRSFRPMLCPRRRHFITMKRLYLLGAFAYVKTPARLHSFTHAHSMKKNTRHSHRYWREKGRKIHASFNDDIFWWVRKWKEMMSVSQMLAGWAKVDGTTMTTTHMTTKKLSFPFLCSHFIHSSPSLPNWSLTSRPIDTQSSSIRNHQMRRHYLGPRTRTTNTVRDYGYKFHKHRHESTIITSRK